MSNDQQTLMEFIKGESGGGVAEALVAQTEPEVHTIAVYGGRCPNCTAPEGVICDYPGEGPGCPIHAYQTPVE